MTKERYDEYLLSDYWLSVRGEALKRAGYRCVLCGETERLHVHHNCYDNLGAEDVFDLTVLCDRHHELYHKWDERHG